MAGKESVTKLANNEEKKKLIIRYVVAVILLVVTILVLKGMYQDAEEHDNAQNTEITTEINHE